MRARRAHIRPPVVPAHRCVCCGSLCACPRICTGPGGPDSPHQSQASCYLRTCSACDVMCVRARRCTTVKMRTLRTAMRTATGKMTKPCQSTARMIHLVQGESAERGKQRCALAAFLATRCLRPARVRTVCQRLKTLPLHVLAHVEACPW